MSVQWPSYGDYAKAVQDSRVFLDDELVKGTVALNRLGLPKPYSGGLGVVFSIHCNNRRYAIKCFVKKVADQYTRYEAIAAHLARTSPSFLAGFNYLANGIKLGSVQYPLLKMEWVEGVTLDAFVEANLGRAEQLLRFAANWRSVMRDLREQGIAHGDLQNGNILVNESGELRLVDYDGMFVPALDGRAGTELGFPEFQHPRRSLADFNRDIDLFASLVIYGSIRALAHDPSLWRYHSERGLILKRDDYLTPRASAPLDQMGKSRDPEVQRLTKALVAACEGPVQSVPLLEEALQGERGTTSPRPARKPIPLPNRIGVDSMWFDPPVATVTLAQKTSSTARVEDTGAQPSLVSPRKLSPRRIVLTAILATLGVSAVIAVSIGAHSDQIDLPTDAPVQRDAPPPTPPCSVAALRCEQSLSQGKSDIKLSKLIQQMNKDGHYGEAVCLAQMIDLGKGQRDARLAGVGWFEIAFAWKKLGCLDRAAEAVHASLAVRPHGDDSWKTTCALCRDIGRGGCEPCNGIEISPTALLQAEHDAIMRGDAKALAALMDPSAFAFGLESGDVAVDRDQIEAMLRHDFDLLRPRKIKVISRRIGQERDHTWIGEELQLTTTSGQTTNLVLTQLAHQVLDASGKHWAVVASHWAVPLENLAARALIAKDALPAPTALDSAGPDGLRATVRSMFSSSRSLVAAFANRQDALNVGSAPNESVGGSRVRRLFPPGQVKISAHDGLRIGTAADWDLTQPSDPWIAWAAGNVDYTATNHGESVTETYRILAVLLRIGDVWKIVQIHWSNPRPDPDLVPAPGDEQVSIIRDEYWKGMEAADSAETAEAERLFRATLADAERVYGVSHHSEALLIAVMSACQLKEADKARMYFSKLPADDRGRRDRATSTCTSLKIALTETDP